MWEKELMVGTLRRILCKKEIPPMESVKIFSS